MGQRDEEVEGRSARRRLGLDPAWLRAPFVLFRFPSIALALFVAAAILAAAAASAAPFLSSVGSAALSSELETTPDISKGIRVDAYGPFAEEQFTPADGALRSAAAKIRGLEEPIVSALSTRLGIFRPGKNRRAQVRLFMRTGALDHIEVIDEAPGSGVWLADTTAGALGIEAGDDIEFRAGNHTHQVRVAGIYRNLALGGLNAYWSRLSFLIIAAQPNEPPPPPFVLAEPDELFEIGSALFQAGTYAWEYEMPADQMPLGRALAIDTAYRTLERELNDPRSPVGRPMSNFSVPYRTVGVHSSMFGIVDRAVEAVDSVRAPIDLFSLAGRLLALLVISAGGVFALSRRRVEMQLMSARGVLPSIQGVRAAVESILPVAAGTAAGWFGALGLVYLLGPSDLITQDSKDEALTQAIRIGAVSIVVLGIVTAVILRRQAEATTSAVGRAVARMPWEAIVLSLAAASFYELSSRQNAIVQTSGEPPSIDIFLIAFPILFVAGSAGVVARLLRRILPHLRRGGAKLPPSLFLASRRLSSAPRLALMLFTAASLAMGILVYSATVVESARETAETKASIAVGSDVAVDAIDLSGEDLARGLGDRSTRVTRKTGEIVGSETTVDIIGVDPETFAETVYWRDAFADQPLQTILDRLDEESRALPVAVVGEGVPDTGTVETSNYQFTMDVVARVDVWPGMHVGRPTLIADSRQMSAIADETGSSIPEELLVAHELLVRGDEVQIRAELAERGFSEESFTTTGEIRRQPALKSLEWTFSFLQALGVMSGLIALVGVILYLQTRQKAREVAFALARRMGLAKRSHLGAVALELAGMLVAALIVGMASALVAARLVFSRLDPLPEIPPGPVFALPTESLLFVLPVIALAAAIGAWRVQRSADTANIAEVLRYAN